MKSSLFFVDLEEEGEGEVVRGKSWSQTVFSISRQSHCWRLPVGMQTRMCFS
jgi:hypothetical protein